MTQARPINLNWGALMVALTLVIQTVAVVYWFGRLSENVTHLGTNISDLKHNSATVERVQAIEQRVDRIDKRVTRLEEKD